MTLEPNHPLLHYRLTEKIGEGGMGIVWRAEDRTLGRDVAIKILPDAFANDTDRLARFESEAKLLGPVPVDETLAIALQLTEALSAAHARGVIHRDLKPANIQLANELRPAPPEPPVRRFFVPVAGANEGDASTKSHAISPDGRHIAYSLEGKLWVRDLDGVEPRELAGIEDADHLFWSPDSAHIGFVSERKVMRVPVEGGPPTEVCEMSGSVRAATWGDDDKVTVQVGAKDVARVSPRGLTYDAATKPARSATERCALAPMDHPNIARVLGSRGVFPRERPGRIELANWESIPIIQA